MNQYTAIILDDEETGRNSLSKFITEYCTEINLLGTAASGEEALDLISKERPQILFFDIEIAQANSDYTTTFDLIPNLPKYDYEIVFVTAYEHYAMQAIRTHAIGYILKPVSISDLVECVNGVLERLQSNGRSERITELIQQINSEEQLPKRIWIHSHKDIVPLNVNEIIRLEAQGKYTDIFCLNGKMYTSSKNLGEFSEILEGIKFIKIHRSHLINSDLIKKYLRADGGSVIMNDDRELPVSKAGKERLFAIL